MTPLPMGGVVELVAAREVPRRFQHSPLQVWADAALIIERIALVSNIDLLRTPHIRSEEETLEKPRARMAGACPFVRSALVAAAFLVASRATGLSRRGSC